MSGRQSIAVGVVGALMLAWGVAGLTRKADATGSDTGMRCRRTTSGLTKTEALDRFPSRHRTALLVQDGSDGPGGTYEEWVCYPASNPEVVMIQYLYRRGDK